MGWTFLHESFNFLFLKLRAFFFLSRIETFIVPLSVVPALDYRDTILMTFQPGSFATSCSIYPKSCPFYLCEGIFLHCLFSLPSQGWFHIFPPCLLSSGVFALHLHTQTMAFCKLANQRNTGPIGALWFCQLLTPPCAWLPHKVPASLSLSI